MKPIAPLLFAAALAAGATPALPADSQVDVRFTDLAKYRDLRNSRMTNDRERQGLADELRKHIEDKAPRLLPSGTRLAVTFTEIDMAGEFWPIAGGPANSDIRVVKDHFPPRIDLDFRLLQADGSLAREGHRELRDPLFLSSVSPMGSDRLRYEKSLLERWLEREFAAPR
jgi:hypothetical protein